MISVLGLVLCCPHLEMLSDLEQGAPYFHVAPGPTNDVASSAQDTSKLRDLVEEETPAKRTQKEWPVRQGEARKCGIEELFKGGNGLVCQMLQSTGMRRRWRIHPWLVKVQIISDYGENLLGGV